MIRSIAAKMNVMIAVIALILATASGWCQEIEVWTEDSTALVDNAPPGDFVLTKFPDTPVGASVSRQFNVLNDDTTHLIVTTVTVTGTNAADFTVDPMQLNFIGHEVKKLIVHFNPQAPGTRTATITITSNDVDEPDYQINVSGLCSTGFFILHPDLRIAATGGKDPTLKVDEKAGTTRAKWKLEVTNLGLIDVETAVAEVYLSDESFFMNANATLLTTIPIGPVRATIPGKKPKKVRLKLKNLDVGTERVRLLVRIVPQMPAIADDDYADNQITDLLLLDLL